MTAHDDALKAAAEAGQGVSHDFLVECGLTDNEADAAINAVAEAAVAAVAPILLAAERALIADLRALCDSRDARSEVQFPNTAGVVATGTIRDLLDRHAARIAETAPEEGS